ncbi:MAG: hypothetical protein C5B50_28210 [Verrucomicrobia bacterium]|nr:MAG: hypothetical protein C5B50_28210 [Verrucomicrobiota bacterium]
MTTTYKEHFTSSSAAADYDSLEYADSSYSALLWELEKPILQGLLDEFRRKHQRVDYLDFAAGTGRVIGFLEDSVESALGIEISADMAARAARRLKKGRVVCSDITAEEMSVEGAFDLITAFRFLLNAESALRIAALQALARRLKDQTSWLVLNNHGNLLSVKLAAWPYHRLRSLGKGWQPRGNYMSHREVCLLAAKAGLQIVKRIGYGVLGGTVCHRLPYKRALRIEQKLLRVGIFQKLAINQIYVLVRSQ